jgi:regulator of replication initiation timing
VTDLPEEDFYTPTDTDALRRENELLALEVNFLRDRLAEAEHSSQELRIRLTESEEATTRLRRRLGKDEQSSISPSRKAQLESAERDLSILLKRLSDSPLGPLLRLRKGYRNLEQRHLKRSE